MIRQANHNDIQSIFELEKKLINQNVEISKIADEIEDLNYKYFVYEEQDIFGYISILITFDSVDIVNIAVDLKKQGLGIGYNLIEFVVAYVENLSKESIILEVNENNEAAINLYIKHNFKVIHKRNNYYGYNQNALIMMRKLKQGE